MEKKESLNPESPKGEGALKSKAAHFSHRILAIIKFILGICLLVFVYSASAGFMREFSLLETPVQVYFWSGVIGFLVVYLFIYEPAGIYRKGQRMVELAFGFFAPLVKFAPYVLPIYSIIIFLTYLLCVFGFKSQEMANYCIFLLGFSFTLHLVFGAKVLRSKQEDFLKANYIFGFSLVYLINLTLLTFAFSLVFKDFSFVNFFDGSFQAARDILGIGFKQLFVP